VKTKKKNPPTHHTSISDCSIFCGIKWEGLGIETLNTTAKALLNITELFKAQQVNVEAGIKVVQAEGPA
jgi:hypothetical protein